MWEIRKYSLVWLAATSSIIFGQAGNFDFSFDADGWVMTNFAGMYDKGNAMVIQPDGKIVVAGESSGIPFMEYGLARYNVDGSLDATFDGDGLVVTDWGWQFADECYGVALQDDGKIVAVGASKEDTTYLYSFSAARYNPDGSLDPTFDGDGLVTTPIWGSNVLAWDVAVQSDGKIVSVGKLNGFPGFLIVRYNTDGSLDNSFDADGFTTVAFAGYTGGESFDVAIQDDDKIIVSGKVWGSGPINFAMARLNDDGSLDNTFDSDGKVVTVFGSGSMDYAEDVLIQPDGKIIIAGGSYTSSAFDYGGFALARYNTDGSLDNSFGGGDGLVCNITALKPHGYAAALQADGKIVVTGQRPSGTSYQMVTMRFNPDGSADGTFVSGGMLITDVGGNAPGPEAVAIQSDGKIVIAGTKSNGTDPDFIVFRFWDVDSSGGAWIETFGESSGMMYPNPATDHVNIKFSYSDRVPASMRIVELNGRVIMNKELPICGGMMDNDIDLSGIAPGTYFVEVTSSEGSLRELLIKQ